MDKGRLAKRKKAQTDFGARLRACRLAAGFKTAVEFVEAFPKEYGLEILAYTTYERGERTPDFYVLPEIARRVHKSVDFLLTGRSRPADLPPVE